MLELLEILKPYAAIISAGTAFISAIAVLISTWFVCFRKTRRDRIDELKVEMQVLFTTESVRQKVLEISESEFFNSLKRKFKTRKDRILHQSAYDELTNEDKNWIVNYRRKYERAEAARANISTPR